MLVPRIALVSTATATPVTNPAGGALEPSTLVYNTATVAGATGVSPGFYFWNGTAWIPISGSRNWSLNGNTGTTKPLGPTTYGATPMAANENYIGTTDAAALTFGTNGLERFRISSEGNIGIGTSTPGNMFQVASRYGGYAVRGMLESTVCADCRGVQGEAITVPGIGYGTIGFGNYMGVYGQGQPPATATSTS